MKIKKRILSLALAGALTLALLPAFSSPALAAEGDTSYTLTIPSTLNVNNSGWNATDGISATGSLESGKKLSVTATSDDEFALVNQSDNTQKVGYILAATSKDTTATTSWTFDSLSNTATTKTMGIIVDDYSNKPAGTYQDTVTFTAKVESAVPAGITLTRNMTAGGDPFEGGSSTDTLSTAFVAGQQVAVFYKNTSGQTAKVLSNALTASDISNEGKSATINVTIDDADKTQPVTYIYPATMANDDGTLNTGALSAQNGTLDEDIINCCTATGAWDGNALPSLELTSPFAIFKFTTQSVPSAGGSLQNTNVTKLTVTIGAQDYVITPASATSTLYAALPAVSGQTVSFTATDGSNLYAASKASVSFDAAKYYQSTVKMGKVIEVLDKDDPYLEDFTRNPYYKYLHIGLEQAYAIARQLSTQNSGATVAVVYNNENRNVTYALSSDASATARTLRGDNLFENNYRVFLATLWEDAD